ncbi:MAG: NrfD/PsrC family molybdoenzyme membrane anchor subunit [Acetobacteraceae bacterium]
MPDSGGWDGSTYYGREQIKAAPFNNWLVGGYIFLAGLSGGTMLLSTLLDLTKGRRAEGTVGRGRYLALLAPTLGTAMLIADLKTPRRFYNMLRLFKATSPMSIGSWLLVAFGVFSTLTAGLHRLSTRVPGLGWLRWLARVAQLPGALTGAGSATYTASLLSATSTPLWAAAPCATAVRFGASSMAAGAAALSLGEGRQSRVGRDLDTVAVVALTAELAATVAADETYRRKGVAAAMETLPGVIEEVGAGGLGMILPLGLHAVSLLLLRRRSPVLSTLASTAILAGSAILRISFMAAGDQSALDPRISMRFAQPENLPHGG